MNRLTRKYSGRLLSSCFLSFFAFLVLSGCSEEGASQNNTNQPVIHGQTTPSKQAARDYTKDKELYEKTTRAQTLLDEYFGRGNNVSEAEKFVEEVIQVDENYVPALLIKTKISMGDTCLSDCESQNNAVNLIEKAIKIDPMYTDTYVLAGHIYSIIGNYDKARGLFFKAQGMGSSNPWLNYNFGYMYYKQRNYNTADKYFEKIVINGPGNTSQQLKAYISALYLQQDIAYQTSQSDRLLTLSKKAVEAAHPEDAWTRGNAADLLCREGFFDEGIEYTRLALSIMQYGKAYKYLSFCYYGRWAQLTKEGKTQEAEIYFNDAYELDPDIKSIAKDYSGSGQILRDLVPVFNERIEAMEASKEDTQNSIGL
jgi:tetratricopeptide (TPR) repeat protein